MSKDKFEKFVLPPILIAASIAGTYCGEFLRMSFWKWMGWI